MTIKAIQLKLRDISFNLIAPMKGVKVGDGEVAGNKLFLALKTKLS